MTRLAISIVLALAAPAAWAKNEPARDYPAAVRLGQSPQGPVYVDTRKRTLYSMSLRWTKARSGVGIEYCGAACLAAWTPLAAPANARPVGEWSVIIGPAGPQWAYADNPVFVFKADPAPGALDGDGWDGLWSALFYVPPKPELVAPPGVAAKAVEGRNLLADATGHPLFTLGSGQPAAAAPFAAGMVSRPIGEWSVLRESDVPQWAWRGKPVFVSATPDPRLLPAGAEAILP